VAPSPFLPRPLGSRLCGSSRSGSSDGWTRRFRARPRGERRRVSEAARWHSDFGEILRRLAALDGPTVSSASKSGRGPRDTAASTSDASFPRWQPRSEISGLRIQPGDILHGDLNGLLTIPVEIAALVPEEVERVREEERKLLEYVKSADFTLRGLRELQARFRH
jgi:hypothetical protein